jgi:PIN domain nuclease of toxin-antitoxin system
VEILLDKHVRLSWLGDDARISRKGRALIAGPTNMLTASAATAWDITIKQDCANWR